MNNICSTNKLIEMYESLYLIRLAEEKLIELNPEQLMKCPHHYAIGQEGVAVGVCSALEKKDQIYSSHRCHGHYLAKGGSLNAFMAEMYNKIDGCTRGKGGSMHLIDTSVGMMGSHGVVGTMIPIAVGAALALKNLKQNNVSVVFFGDGGADQGILYESLNFAVLKNLPVIFVCENNGFASFSKAAERHAQRDISIRAQSFGIPSSSIFGQDVLKVYETMTEAVNKARRGKGPSFIETETYRFKAHCGIEEDISPHLRTKEELDKQKESCPINLFEKYMFENNIIVEKTKKEIIQRKQNEINNAVEFGRKSPLPGPEELFKGVFA
jgi:acetoin:2,6-dichlorophenolindophenol oxidoreductase subunit alpha